MVYLSVDNTDIVKGSDNVNTSSEALIPNFQQFMRWWNGGIKASDRLVYLNKTKLFLIDFKWNGSYYKYQPIEDMPGNISIPNEEGYMITITRKEPSSANESLGILPVMKMN